MKIFDCFMFFNELELLELRLMTLNSIVDHFVIVEVGMTFTGKKKEFYFENNKKYFKKYLNKIIYIKKDNLPISEVHTRQDAFQNEYYNRNLIFEGLSGANGDDYIILSDIDEIPNPKAVLEGISSEFKVFVLKQKLFYYYVNCLQKQEWFGTVVTKRKDLESPKALRRKRNICVNVIENGGWHYSFLGGEEKIKLKLESYAELKTNNDVINNREHLLKCLEFGDDLFNRTEELYHKKFIKLNEIDHPEINEWILKHPNMIKQQ